MWALLAAARREVGSDTSSLTADTLLRTSADTGEDTGADAMMFSALALAADAPPALIIDGSVATGASPSGVAVSGDKVYVTNQGAGTLTVYNRSDNSVLATVPVGASPSAVVVNSVGTRAYVANSAAGTVSVINTANNSVMTNIKVGVGPSSLALTPDGTRLFVTNGGAGTVTKIDTATNGVTVAAIKVGNGPSSIAVSPDGLYAYVTNSTDNTVSVITLSYNVVKTITGVGTSPTGVVAGGGKVYVSNLGGTIAVISAASNTVTGQVTAGAPVEALALSADGATLFAATRSDTVVAIDVATAAVISTVTTDLTPDTVSTPALAVAADGTIYQTDSTDNALRILHLGTVTAPVNQAPVVGAPVVGSPNAQTGVVTGSVVASDPDGNPLSYNVTTVPTYGSVTLNGASFTYTPSAQRPPSVTQDSFVVTVSDGQASVTSAVTVAVLPLPAVNQPPTVGVPVVGSPNAQTGVVTGSVVASDPDGNPLSYNVTTVPTYGSVTLSGASFTYTPSAQRPPSVTQDSFVVTVSDGQASVTSPVSVTVLPLPTNNQPQLAVDGSVGTGGSPSGVAVSGDKVFVTNQVSGTMTVYRKSDNAVLATVNVGASPTAVVVNSVGTRAYVANSGAGTVTVYDTSTYGQVASIKVGLSPSSLALTPDGTRLLVTNSASNTVTKINTATNGVTTLAIAVGKAPSSIAVSADSTTAYVTNATDNSVTVITLSYNATKTIAGVGTSPTSAVLGGGKLYVGNLDGSVTVISAASNTVTGQVTVGAPVKSLALSADGTKLFVATRSDSVVAVDVATAAAVSTVTTDPTPDTVSTPALVVAADGTIYQTDSTDNALRILHLGTVSVPVNQPPVAGVPVVGSPNASTGVVTGSIVASDPDGNPLSYTVTTPPTYGSVTLNGASFTYTPSAQRPPSATQDSFVVTVSDGQATTTSTVSVAVLPVNQAPVAGAPVVGSPNASTGVVTGSIVASDPDGNPLSYTVTTQPTYGSVTLNGASFTYTPSASRPQSATQDGFVVTVSDGQASVASTVSVTVLPPVNTNHPPELDSPFVGSADPQTGVVIGVISALDPDGDPLVYSVSTPTYGAVAIGNDGTFTYTPNTQGRQSATQDSFAVTVSDGKATASTTVIVPVAPLPTNHAPVVGPPIVGTPNSQTAVVTGNIVASDPDGNQLSYTVSTAPTYGAVSVAGDGSFTYTPTLQGRQSATQDGFVVTVSDGQATVTSAVTVTVLPLPVSNQPHLVVDASVGTGGSPSGVAVSGDKVFVTNQSAGTMTVYRKSDNAVLATVNVGGSPSAVVVNSAGTRAYVANSSTGQVNVIDTSTYTSVANVKAGTTPSALALTPDGTRLLVVNTGSNSVTKINTATNTVTTQTIVVGKGPSSIAVSADSATAYVTNTTDNSVTVITLSVNSTKTVAGVGSSPTSAVFSGGKVYVGNLDGTVAVIAASSNTVAGHVTVGAPVRSLALSADGTQLFAATRSDTVVAINVATGTVVSTVTSDPTPDAASTPALAVAADGTIYQTDSSDNALRVLKFTVAPPNATPVVGTPIVGAPDSQTAVVTGKVVASDPDGDALTYSVTTAPKYGSVSIGSDGSFTYTPSTNGQLYAQNSGGQLPDQFVVTVGDGRTSVTSSVTVAVIPAAATLKTGTFNFEPGIVTATVSTANEYDSRQMMEFPVDPYKMRVHIANYNVLQDQMANDGSLDEISLWIGQAALGADGKPTGAFVPGTQVQIPISDTLASGQWGTSDWLIDGKDFNFDPDKQYIFSYGFGTPGGKLSTAGGGATQGWISSDAGDAGATAPALKANTNAYLDVWFEYQYADQGQPSMFVVSNSSAYNLSKATGTKGVMDTWENQWAETYHGVVAGNIAAPATWSTSFTDPTKRWTFYNDKLEIPLDPDYVVYMVLNSSDAASDKNASQFATIQTHTLQALAAGELTFPEANQILSEISPRTGFVTVDMENERKALNAWMDTLPGGADGIIRIGDLLSDDQVPARMLPQYTGDGIHWTPAGVAVVVSQMNLPGLVQSSSPSAVPATVRVSIQPALLVDPSLTCPADPALPCGVDPTVAFTQHTSGEPIKVDQPV